MSDILSAATLLLTLIGLLYTVWYPDLSGVLETKIPEFVEDRKRPLRRVHSALVTKAVPLAAFSFLLTLVFLPVALSIAFQSIRLFAYRGLPYFESYDPVATAFFFVVVASTVFSVHLIVMVKRLYYLRRRLDSRE